MTDLALNFLKENAALPMTWSNVKAIYEIKFAGDGYTPNQVDALRNPQVSAKLNSVYAEDFAFDCDMRERDARA